MELSATMTAQEQAVLKTQVDTFNKVLSDGKVRSNELGKDDFIKILITQLTHQDPTSPMEDKEFISQMAQFSSLEQMTNMAQDFSRLANILGSGEAINSLGKSVEILDGEQVVQGKVSSVSRGDYAQVMVNGNSYDWDNVSRVFEE